VAAGTMAANQPVMWIDGKPSSTMVGSCGTACMRCAVLTARLRMRPSRSWTRANTGSTIPKSRAPLAKSFRLTVWNIDRRDSGRELVELTHHLTGDVRLHVARFLTLPLHTFSQLGESPVGRLRRDRDHERLPVDR